jgi:type II secretory pathway pseudopilin PulG
MNKQLSLGKLSKGSLSSIKLPKGITITQVVLIVVGIVLLALTIYFAVSYFSAVSDKKDVNKSILQKQQQIGSMGALQNIAALESQLEDAQNDLIDKSPFPDEINNADVAYAIIQAAREASITCFSYAPITATITAVSNGSYIANRYSITSQGAGDTTGEKIVRITNFLEELEDSYDTASLSGISMTDGENDDLWGFSVTLSILSLQ